MTKKIAIIATDGFEDAELLYPFYRLKEAGVKFEDVPVVIDGNLITSRMPSDLPDFVFFPERKLASLL